MKPIRNFLNKFILLIIIITMNSCGPGFYINDEPEYYGGYDSYDGYYESDDNNEETCKYSSVTADAVFSYRFETSTINNGTTIVDLSGNNRTAIFEADGGDVTNKVVPGRHGNGVDFDEVDDRIKQSPTLGYTNVAAFTYSLWFKHDGDLAGSQSQFLIAMGTTNLANSFNFILGEDSHGSHAGKFRLFAHASSTTASPLEFAHTGYLDDNWHHLVITKSSSGLTIYVDNVVVASNGAMATANYTGWDDIYFGDKFDGTTREFDGQMDEINFWSRELTATEITQLYECDPL